MGKGRTGESLCLHVRCAALESIWPGQALSEFAASECAAAAAKDAVAVLRCDADHCFSALPLLEAAVLCRELVWASGKAAL